MERSSDLATLSVIVKLICYFKCIWVGFDHTLQVGIDLALGQDAGHVRSQIKSIKSASPLPGVSVPGRKRRIGERSNLLT